MTYQKPTCDCGNDLIISEVLSVEHIYKVRDEGVPYKYPSSSSNSHSYSNLYCEECQVSYSIDYDEKGRLLRGDTVS